MTSPVTKSQAYDHPAYITPLLVPCFTGGTMASGQVAGRFAAFTSMILKSAQMTVLAAGTNTSTIALVKVAAASTATSTIVNIIVGTAGTAGVQLGTTQGQTISIGLGTTTLLAGDAIEFLNGIDLSLQVAVGIEAYLVPGANVTV